MKNFKTNLKNLSNEHQKQNIMTRYHNFVDFARKLDIQRMIWARIKPVLFIIYSETLQNPFFPRGLMCYNHMPMAMNDSCHWTNYFIQRGEEEVEIIGVPYDVRQQM